MLFVLAKCFEPSEICAWKVSKNCQGTLNDAESCSWNTRPLMLVGSDWSQRWSNWKAEEALSWKSRNCIIVLNLLECAFWLLDLQSGRLGFSSVSIYSDNSKPQECYINLLLAKSFSQLPLLPCVLVIFVTKSEGYCGLCVWSLCFKDFIAKCRMHPSAEVGLSCRARISLMLSVPLHSTQLEWGFPSSPLSLD